MVDDAGSTIANFFLNPISGEKVMLPSQTTIPCNKNINQASFFSKFVASSVPTNPDSCLVAAICPQACALAFYRPFDKSWMLIEAVDNVVWALKNVHGIEILDGKLYAIAHKLLYVFDIHLDCTSSNGDAPHDTYRAERLEPYWPILKCGDWSYRHTEHDGGCKHSYQTLSVHKLYLFKDSASNELLMISVYVSDPSSVSDVFWCSQVDDTNFVTPTHHWDQDIEAFQVFKLVHNSSGPEWVEVFDLGDRILFLSKPTKLFLPVTNDQYGLPHEKSTVGGNRIYFTFGRWKKHDVGVFSLTDNSIQHYTVSEDHSPSRDTSPWFTPSL